MTRPLAPVVALVVASLALLADPPEARAELTIKNPDQHPSYRWELEPHGVIAAWHRRFGKDYGGRSFGNADLGAGFRASVEIADPAFVPSINNTIAISFGPDFTSCTGCFHDFQVFFPVALQWNFWLTDKWSVFAEVGPMLRSFEFFDQIYFDFNTHVGGRFSFNDTVALTMRVGYPFTFAIGASFFVGG